MTWQNWCTMTYDRWRIRFFVVATAMTTRPVAGSDVVQPVLGFVSVHRHDVDPEADVAAEQSSDGLPVAEVVGCRRNFSARVCAQASLLTSPSQAFPRPCSAR